MDAKLVYLDPQGRECGVRLDGEGGFLGRAPDCLIVLLGVRVHRHHCKVERDGDGWSVVDVRSQEGTFVNGEKITRRLLVPGDAIRCGDAEVRFVEDANTDDDDD